MAFSGIYAIVIGALMIIQWNFSILKGQVAGPDISSSGRGRIEMAFHWTAEAVTAVLLIVSGVGMIKGLDWGLTSFLIAIGMLIYTAVNSPGYFAQQRKWPMVAMFAVVLTLALVSISLIV